MPRASVAPTSTKCVGGFIAATYAAVIPCHGSPSSGNSQRFAASRHASIAARPTDAVVGVVDRAVVAPRELEVHRDHDIGAEPAVRRAEVASQGDPVLERAVGVAEELDRATRRRPRRCGAPRRSRSGPASSGAMPSMPASPRCRQDVRHLFALIASSAPTALASPYSRSSGCATTATARCQSSGKGSTVTSYPRNASRVGHGRTWVPGCRRREQECARRSGSRSGRTSAPRHAPMPAPAAAPPT